MNDKAKIRCQEDDEQKALIFECHGREGESERSALWREEISDLVERDGDAVDGNVFKDCRSSMKEGGEKKELPVLSQRLL